MLVISFVNAQNDGFGFIFLSIYSFVDFPEIIDFLHHLGLIVLIVRKEVLESYRFLQPLLDLIFNQVRLDDFEIFFVV